MGKTRNKLSKKLVGGNDNFLWVVGDLVWGQDLKTSLIEVRNWDICKDLFGIDSLGYFSDQIY